MHIMLVNDDGIHAPGIRALCAAAVAAGHKVSVCAPDCERSAASHSITLRRPLKARKVDFPCAQTAYAVDGTPADCARLGLYLIPDVDMVISGINNGPNMGGACIYSGTVGAAMEASMSGKPALATSLCAFNTDDYEAAARLSITVAEWMTDHALPRGVLYNLNIPALPYGEIRGVRPATLGMSYLDDPAYIEVETESGAAYDYTHGADSVQIDDENCDICLTEKGFASLTKLTWDLRLNAPDPDVTGIRL